MEDMPEFDHLELPESHRQLMRLASGNARRIFLAPMDKGLSGASVWQARWQLPWGGLSKLHVFKIGAYRKLAREERAVIDIASVIEPHFPLMRLYALEGSELALLRQEFSGDPEGKTQSLRQYLQNKQSCPDARSSMAILSKLYLKRMNAWHPNPAKGRAGGFETEQNSIEVAIPWWFGKVNLQEAAHQIGYKALNSSLIHHFGVTIDDLSRSVEKIFKLSIAMEIGPVHGDLHAQNVNIDRRQNIYLIDFGMTGKFWRAVDFLVMEAALKFVVSPPNARLDDLLLLDDVTERQWGRIRSVNCSPLEGCMHGRELEKIAASICVTRRCAQYLGAIRSSEPYRLGLICLTASLASIDMLINRVFLFHSLAKQIKLSKAALAL